MPTCDLKLPRSQGSWFPHHEVNQTEAQQWEFKALNAVWRKDATLRGPPTPISIRVVTGWKSLQGPFGHLSERKMLSL